jgi:hypothetical protein
VAFDTRSRLVRRRVRAKGHIVTFRVSGLVDERPAQAWWVPAHGLVCGDELRARAELVVAMGDTFSGADSRVVEASLADPSAAMLTVLRAMSRVTSLEIVPNRDDRG